MKKWTMLWSVIIVVAFVFCGISVQAAKDKKSPKMISSSVKNNQKRVSVNSKISVKFSERIVKGKMFKKIKLFKGKKGVKIVTKISKKSLTIVPKKKLIKGSKYVLTIPSKALKDKAGNSLKKTIKIKFSTISNEETSKPNNDVVPGETAIPGATSGVMPGASHSATPSATPTQEPTPEPTPFPTPYWDVEASAAPKFIGRFNVKDPINNAEVTWPGAVIDAWFEGTEVSVNLNSNDCYVQVIIDGRDMGKMLVNSDGSYQLATDLELGIHNVKLVKRTEGWNTLTFKGFEFNGGRLLAPEPLLERRIEFVGDSITCGYGADAQGPGEPYSNENSNAYLAFGPVTARNLNAEYHLIAVSGIGALKANGPGVIQKAYDYVGLWTPGWDHSQWQPNVVVVNICTNDMNKELNNGELPTKEQFGSVYLELLTKIRDKNLNAKIICTVGPMLGGNELARSKEGIEYAMDQMSDANISFLEFAGQDSADGFGSDWHPSVKTHAKMANKLTAEIKRVTGWN